jgi:3-deoxy-manno-octulosonate cytidylyltransferase (CMP-KDO synthetase)
MKVVGIIPARFASSRLPGKPLILINKKPMIQRVYEQALKSKYINSVIVATDDMDIFNCVKKFGGNAMMTSIKHKSGTDRIAEVAGKIKCDIVVNIQGDEPFIDPKNIDMAIEPFLKDKKLNVSTLACKFTHKQELEDVNKVKVVFDKNNFALYFTRNIIPYDVDDLLIVSDYYKHIGLYVYRKNFLLKFSKLKKSRLESAEKLEQLRILENGERIKVVITKKDSVSIDTLEDLSLVNQSTN